MELLSQNDPLAEAIFQIAVEAVNDAPFVVTPSHTIELEEDARPMTIQGIYVTDPDVHETPESKIEVSRSLLDNKWVSSSEHVGAAVLKRKTIERRNGKSRGAFFTRQERKVIAMSCFFSVKHALAFCSQCTDTVRA